MSSKWPMHPCSQYTHSPPCAAFASARWPWTTIIFYSPVPLSCPVTVKVLMLQGHLTPCAILLPLCQLKFSSTTLSLWAVQSCTVPFPMLQEHLTLCTIQPLWHCAGLSSQGILTGTPDCLIYPRPKILSGLKAFHGPVHHARLLVAGRRCCQSTGFPQGHNLPARVSAAGRPRKDH